MFQVQRQQPGYSRAAVKGAASAMWPAYAECFAKLRASVGASVRCALLLLRARLL